MTTATGAPPQLEKPVITHAQLCQLLTREQYFALARLAGLLARRDAVDAERLTTSPEDQPWLVRALDAAIVSYYRLAHALGLGTDADVLLQGYRHLGLGTSSTLVSAGQNR